MKIPILTAMAKKQWNCVLVGVDLVDIYMMNPVNLGYLGIRIA